MSQVFGVPAASKLSPHEQQIRAWRAQSWNFAEISTALEKQFGLKIHRTAIGKFCRRRGIKIADERFHPSLKQPGEIDVPAGSDSAKEGPQNEPDLDASTDKETPSTGDTIRNRIQEEEADRNAQGRKRYSKEEMDKMLAAERERKRKEMRGE